MGEAKGLITIALVTIVILLGGVFLLSGKKPATQSPISVNPEILVRQTSHQTNPTAPITIVEFGDYQCPACGETYPATKELIKNYGDKINFVFRNYPLSQHKNAFMASQAAEAAGDQGKFWEMYDKLFINQDAWSDSTTALDLFTTYAQEIGLDTAKFKQDVEDNKFAALIQADVSDGNNAAITGTPTFFVNGTLLPGLPSYADFKSLVDSLLLN